MPETSTWTPIPCLAAADIDLPRPVEKLYDVAYNFWWTWNPQAQLLFRGIDVATWQRYRNPVQLLINVDRRQWEPILESDNFMTGYREVVRDFEAYRDGLADTWFHRRYPGYEGGPIAYFSMEYGLHQSLAIYSGGLGVLSGDHAKSASDLGLPFIAVGLLYRHGYFRQTIDADGLQQHSYPEYDFSRLPLRPAATRTGRPIQVSVPLPGREVKVKVWVAGVGRVPLLLLDTDVPENDPADRPITGTLYVGGREMRLVQEIVLGVGGVAALRALGLEPAVWHMNEGHCALMQLERMRELVATGRVDAARALEVVKAGSVFTTHTPVPAGNETFERELAEKYMGRWAGALGMPVGELLALADAGRPGEPPFNLTALALRTSRSANAVSHLNAEVTSEMWGHLLQAPEGGEPPIFPITNGIHTATWVGREMRALFVRCLGPHWQDQLLDEEAWQRILEIADEDLWAAHQAQKARLGRFMRSRLREQFARHGRSPDELRQVEGLFDPEVLTLGFARRFATYKRAKLIFTQREILRDLVNADGRPIQLVFAGKAHPADRDGQAMIEGIFKLSQSDDFRGRVFFLEDYDMRIGQRMVQGVDVWLNTPRRPMEASGTSGQKAAMNGALNLSILDGWWPEGYDGENGWAIANGPVEGGEGAQDEADAEALYKVLAEDVVPTYYQRNGANLPPAWVARMRRAIATITPRFASARMVREYTEQAYYPDGAG